ncbi:TetR/AcrR family transcriptional regulator C-terminal domain-containing protein [Nocardiopsis lambiniae]|uniref:TetR/AcrR family transcriptional regulator C-terminal domain-containing protein n=1 Tax=Nocardiopsis lambiniae TaxID=3075539 RepID=A0ABU2M491_9ACTN|nr:TetR/AcrR family transcriptional regulator C-terminal domain-containing protein [Nocardiopsis sp. DSM 44743]MDT0327445.1 TetR/AcrR family transcriptional regulator C-terminal domain-containing protein [Nocardiopsis sp. DSM 44743]
MAAAGASRRGRPRAGEQARRRRAALEAALAELLERGVAGITMQAVATRAGSSKESLYAWFGHRQGLLAALIEWQAEQVNAAVATALDRSADPRDTLTAIARNLLMLLVGDVSVALNRAAMTSPELAELLLRHGRYTTGPLVAEFLGHLADEGVLRVDDPEEAFQFFYGLVVRDLQIRVLLGERPPGEEDIRVQARIAVDRFLALAGADGFAR